jgi:predicted dinucleotide-binding enzyme
MRIAILGTGAVGRALAGRLAELGHGVTVGTRDVDTTRARPEWGAGAPGLATFAAAAAGAELVVHASGGSAALDVLVAVGEENLAGKVLLDVANPLDFSGGFPPSLFVKDTDSLAERIQRTFPSARVVKSLNTVNAELMVDPGALGEEHTMFVAGDDPGAKRVVSGLLGEFGWRDVIDLGDLSGARGMEMFVPLWLRVFGSLGTAAFGVRVVR